MHVKDIRQNCNW